MIASVHVSDVGFRSALGVLRRAPRPKSIPGLRNANVALAAPLSRSVVPAPQLGRVGLVAFWDDDATLDTFLADHSLAAKVASGWRARLAPLRVHGSWPGVPDDLPKERTVEHDGSAVVITLGWVRVARVVPFVRASARAEGSVVGAPGLIWATGLARPPFVSTCSVWQDTRALSTYAYGQRELAHPDAIAEDAAEPFHHQSAFIRFRPYGSEGSLGGRNPLPATWMNASRS